MLLSKKKPIAYANGFFFLMRRKKNISINWLRCREDYIKNINKN
jgi:hypothetical protein